MSFRMFTGHWGQVSAHTVPRFSMGCWFPSADLCGPRVLWTPALYHTCGPRVSPALRPLFSRYSRGLLRTGVFNVSEVWFTNVFTLWVMLLGCHLTAYRYTEGHVACPVFF